MICVMALSPFEIYACAMGHVEVIVNSTVRTTHAVLKVTPQAPDGCRSWALVTTKMSWTLWRHCCLPTPDVCRVLGYPGSMQVEIHYLTLPRAHG